MKILRYALTGAALLGTLTACGSNSSSTWPISSQLVTTGYIQTIAFRNHTAMGWGNNGYGQLGNGTNANSLIPVPIAGLPKVKDVVTGGTDSLALDNLGGVWSWGNNGYGQLGSGTVTATYQPVKVFSNKTSAHTHLSNVTAVAAGGNHSLALDATGSVWAWGANTWGQLGYNPDPLTPGYNTYAMIVQAAPGSGGFTASAIAAGGVFSLALDVNGSVWAWGNSYGGQLGDGLPTDTTVNIATQVPAQVVGLLNSGIRLLGSVKAIAAGGSHSLALLNDGTVAAWGYDNYGQLGNNAVVSSSAPVKVVIDANNTPLSGVIAIAAGLDHSLALKSDGTLWAWGYNGYGQLGQGTMIDSHLAVQVPGLAAIDRILAIGHHSLAFSGARGWSWGHNAYGQVGVNSTTDVLVPTVIFGFP